MATSPFTFARRTTLPLPDPDLQFDITPDTPAGRGTTIDIIIIIIFPSIIV
jgi:hypothetical protein